MILKRSITLFNNLKISFFLFIILILNINYDEKTNSNNNFKKSKLSGIYKIYTLASNQSLSIKNKNYKTSSKHLSNKYFRVYSSEIKPYYYIELKYNNLKFGVKENNNFVLYKNNPNNITKFYGR